MKSNMQKCPKIIKIDREKLSCHSMALKAFLFDDGTTNQFDSNLIIDEITDSISQYSYPVVMQNNDGNYNFISGWNWLKLKNKGNIISVILVTATLDKEEIRNIAWAYVMGNQLLSWNHKICLERFEYLLRSIPRNLLKSQLKKLKKQNAVTATEIISNETRAVVRTQIDKAKYAVY